MKKYDVIFIRELNGSYPKLNTYQEINIKR
jgi:hypothetical protein